ncbi:hypothetical protein TRFO_23705 [Tritrichomonas foetus]|uniref:Uncharacterized protein n=1 Tax=Tritrichomonas foetus TaxID=1144522 RepID=A0A1J4KE54_9EUKA|nr:hypothetical protein TRFO_23705 [Tritrichomonas foetus]|eukprot:OHT07996.1 hypothetical protein TRFO_23705 [Tritrichomonas foetus]
MIADINENKIEATVNMIIEKGYNKSPYLEQLANLILYFVSIKENKISIYLKLIDELSKNCEIIHWLKCHLYSKSETRSLVFEKNIL